MRKGILYAILLLTIGIIASNAFAWTTWPHEDCNTWIELNATGTDISITQSGCYVLTGDIPNMVHISVQDANGQPLVFDLNGHSIGYLDIQAEYNGPVEFYNGEISSGYLGLYPIQAIYLHDLTPVVITAFPTKILDVNNIHGPYGWSQLEVYGSGSMDYIRIQNSNIPFLHVLHSGSKQLIVRNVTSTDRAIFDVSDSNVVFENSKFPKWTVITAATTGTLPRSISITNTTVGGAPLYYDNNTADWVADNAYLVDTIPTSSHTSVRQLICLLCGSTTDVNAPPANAISVSSFRNIFNYNGTLVVVDNAYLHKVYNSDVTINADVLFVNDPNNIVSGSQIHTPQFWVYTDLNAQDSTLDAYTTLQAYNGSKLYIGTLIANSVYLYGGGESEYNYEVNTWNVGSATAYLYVSNNLTTVRFDRTHFTAPEYVFTNNQGQVTLYLNGDNVKYIFDSVSVDDNMTIHLNCQDTGQTVYFEGTTPVNKFTVSGCNVNDNTIKPNLTISTNQQYEDVKEGTPVEFNVTVTSENAPVDNVVVRAIADNYYHQFDQNKEIIIPHLDANQSKTITFEFNLQSSPSTYKLTATVDPDNQIEESDETDNTTTHVYVNVIRELNSCPGTISTGMYRLTTHLSDVNDRCIVVPSDAIVYLSAGAGIEGSSPWTTVIANYGNLQIGGMWGKGKIYNSSTGTLMLYYLQKMNSTGFYVYNDGTLYIGSHNEIPFLMQTGGTIKVMGNDNIVNEYTPYDFAGNRDLKFSFIGGTLSIHGYESNYMTSTIYADQPINDPTGVYVYLDQQPSFAQGVNTVRGIIIGDGLSAAFDGKTIGAIFVGGKKGVSQDLNISNSRITGSEILLDNQPNQDDLNYPIYARFSNTEIRLSDGIIANGAITYFTNSTVSAQYARYFKASEMYVKDSEINIPHFNIYVPSDVNLQIYVDLSDGDSTIDFGEIQSGAVTLHCVGDHTLHLAQWMLDSNKVTIDPSCYQNIDYTKNLRVSVSAPSSVPTDTNYSIMVSVYNDAKYTTFNNVPVVVYIDDVPVYETNVDVPPESNTSFEVTAHSSSDVGTATIRVVVDPNNQIPEANEQDNVATTSVAIEAHTAPSSAPAPVVGAGGNAGLSATEGLYVSAKVGEETEAAIHIYWKYGFPVTANITYIPEGGKIYGPDTVKLHTGDNIIKVKVVPEKYGEVGKVVVSAMNEHSTITLYARPLAQIAIPNIDARVVVVLAIVGYLVWALLA